MTYIEALADEIRAESPNDLLPEGDSHALFLIYAVLCLAKGSAVTQEDVHNAWSAWIVSSHQEHESVVPFAELPPEVQSEDSAFVRAIRRVAQRQGLG